MYYHDEIGISYYIYKYYWYSAILQLRKID